MYKVFIILIAFISLIFISNNSELPYDKLILFTFTNKNFLAPIFYLIFVFVIMQVLNITNSNNHLLLKLENRLNFVKFNIRILIKVSLMYFAEIFIIFLIIANITPHTPFIMTSDLGYNCLDIIVAIVLISKVYFTLVSLGLISILLYIILNKKNISLILMLIYITIIYFCDKFLGNNKFLNAFNPSYHSHGGYYTNNIYFCIFSGIIFFSTVYLLCYFLIKINIDRAHLGMDVEK